MPATCDLLGPLELIHAMATALSVVIPLVARGPLVAQERRYTSHHPLRPRAVTAQKSTTEVPSHTAYRSYRLTVGSQCGGSRLTT